MDKEQIILAFRLRDFRKRKGISQSELAKTVGISQSTISEIEAGKHKPTRWTIAKLVKAIGPNGLEELSDDTFLDLAVRIIRDEIKNQL